MTNEHLTAREVQMLKAMRSYIDRTLKGQVGDACGFLSAFVNTCDSYRDDVIRRDDNGLNVDTLPQVSRTDALVSFLLSHDAGRPF